MLYPVVKRLMPLLQATDESTLCAQALQLWHQYAHIDRGWFLQLSFDGRDLQVIAQLEKQLATPMQGIRFSCEKFDQPFSHVAFNAKALTLRHLSQHQNLHHPQYLQWIASAGDDIQLLIEPLYLEGKLQGLWAIQHSEEQSLDTRDAKAIKQLVLMRLAQLQHSRNEQVNQSSLVSSLNALHIDATNAKHKQVLLQSIIGESAEVDKLQQKIIVAARSTLNVLIQGETGVGKELVAKAIHQLSDRAEQPFIALNCAAIPDSLLESELFGFVKGAFSGALHHSKGLLGQSHQGVFFLDEIGDMPLAIQAKLLRVLETRKYRQLGGSEELPCDFRLVAATHRTLTTLIKQQRFRNDLFYRLNSFPITVVPLRQRKSDIGLLSRHFIENFNRTHQRLVMGISHHALAQLNSLEFSGNIRELKNIIELACVHCAEGAQISAIELSDIADISEADHPEPNSEQGAATPYHFQEINNLKAAVAKFEGQVIKQRLVQCGGNKTRAAQTLGVPRRTFTHICQRLELNNSEK